MGAVTITVDDDHLDKIQQVADALRGSGMTIDQVLSDIGVISGSVSDEGRQKLKAVAGVDSVEEPHRYQLPPPESPVQ